MFTQSAPTLFNALQGVLPDNAVRALAQALGNCQQPLTHRAPVNFAGAQPANRNGVMMGGTWSPQFYQNEISYNSPQYFYEAPKVGGYTNGNWYSTNYQGPQFFFPTTQEFQANSYYGGPTFNVGGNSFFQNIFSGGVESPAVSAGTVAADSVNVTYINGSPFVTPASAPSQIGEPTLVNNAIGGREDDGFGAMWRQVEAGRRANKRIVVDVRNSGTGEMYVDVPYTTKATLNQDCTISLEDDVVSLPVVGDPDVQKDTLYYLEPT